VPITAGVAGMNKAGEGHTSGRGRNVGGQETRGNQFWLAGFWDSETQSGPSWPWHFCTLSLEGHERSKFSAWADVDMASGVRARGVSGWKKIDRCFGMGRCFSLRS
jgi:hypothetical protein